LLAHSPDQLIRKFGGSHGLGTAKFAEYARERRERTLKGKSASSPALPFSILSRCFAGNLRAPGFSSYYQFHIARRSSAMNELIQVTDGCDVAAIRTLFAEYAASLIIDLSFQHFEDELGSLPGDYSPPRGALFLCRADGIAAGCIGLRPFSDSVGELKRLYVVPAFRGHGFARRLVGAAITSAKDIGYGELVLDTLASMRSAISLYESFGFTRTDAYYANPHPDALYFHAFLESGCNA